MSLAGLVLFAPHLQAQHPGGEPPATTEVVEGEDFRVYDGKGHASSFADILAAVDRNEAVLVGETHDDVVGHGVEAQLFIRAAERVGALPDNGQGRTVILSLEMFERDVQYILNEYLNGLITEDQFEKSTRPWDRYATDYRPMVEFARAHHLQVIAANAPRRYVNRVSRLGPGSLDSLSDEAKSFLPPLPYPGPSKKYREQWDALMAEMMQGMRAHSDSTRESASPDSAAPSQADTTSREAPPPPIHDMGNAIMAQALWDAAMGEAVAGALKEHPGALVIHYAGAFHVERGTGIPELIQDYRPGTRVLTVVLQPAEDINAWDDDDDGGLGDFVVLTRKVAKAPAGGPGASSLPR